MKTGTVLFTYHRSSHTEKVIKALSENDVLPEKLYIFQDGIKSTTNRTEWEKVNRLIKSIRWCETELHISEENKGLAESVKSGVGYVLQECDAVIVLEDDCVPQKEFMRFMVTALDTWQTAGSVYSVSGYAWNIDLPDCKEDAYFNGRCCSYGWGTWKDRWIQYEEDYHLLEKIRADADARERLRIWGQDLEGMLTGNITGQCDSWAVFWALKIIEKGGYCLSSCKQLVYNTGFDGTGEHGVSLRQERPAEADASRRTFRFPQKIESTKECREEFRFMFAGKYGKEKMELYQTILLQWIQMKQAGLRITLPGDQGKRIAVWGRGKIFDCLYREIRDQVSVEYIIESRPAVNSYKGIPVISIHELPAYIREVIVIPYFDLDLIKRKVDKIKPGIRLVGIDQLLQEKNEIEY